MEKTMEKIVALAKARGFVYPGSEIYGGLANTWDYGNLGVELKNNVKKAWWQKFIQESPYTFVGQFTQIRPYNKGRQPESATNQPDIGRCTAQHLHILRQYRNIQIKSSVIQKISQAKQNKIH